MNNNYYKKGNTRTEEYLDRVVKRISRSDYKRILDNYHYIVDPNMDNDVDRIKSLVCMMPSCYCASINMEVMQLIKGPMFRIDKDYDKCLCKVSRRIVESMPADGVDYLCKFMDKHKHCPDRFKTKEFLLMIILMQMIDEYSLNLDNYSDEELFIKMKGYVGSYITLYGY